MKFSNTINPFYPAFSKDFILNAKIDLVTAEEKFKDAYSAACQGTVATEALQWTSDIEVYRTYAESEVKLETAQERFHRLLEGNIAALNGKKISSIVDEYNDWLNERMLFGGDLKKIDEAVERFKQRHLQK